MDLSICSGPPSIGGSLVLENQFHKIKRQKKLKKTKERVLGAQLIQYYITDLTS